MRRVRLPAIPMVGWNIVVLAMYEREFKVGDGVGLGMQDQVNGWDHDMSVDNEKVMAEFGAPLSVREPENVKETASVVGSGEVHR